MDAYDNLSYLWIIGRLAIKIILAIKMIEEKFMSKTSSRPIHKGGTGGRGLNRSRFADHFRNLCCCSLLLASLTVLFAPAAMADYLATQNIRLFPQDYDDLLNGVDVGDTFDIVVETTPLSTGKNFGHAAWSTMYIPAGLTVIDAFYAVPQPNGIYVESAAEPTDETYNNCGKRGCKNYTPTTGTVRLGNGFVNEVQQDTGLFYSTDTRTALVKAGFGTVNPTGVGANQAYNEWDYDQVKAFGEGGALAGNGGQGNTPVISVDSGTTWNGTGAPVAGPDTYYRNDYNPSATVGGTCPDGTTTILTSSNTFARKIQCIGPWNRINTLGAQLGSGRSPLEGTTLDNENDIQNTAVPATGSYFNLDGTQATGLPDGSNLATTTGGSAVTNAIRIVHGARRIGDLETWVVRVAINNTTEFTAALENETICADSIPGDTSDIAAKDNNWRYYEVSQNCLDIDKDAILVKTITAVNGVANGGSAVQPGDLITYEIAFANTSGALMTDVVFKDQGTAFLTLKSPGAPNSGNTANCPASYGSTAASDVAGIIFSGISGGLATWDAFSLPAGEVAIVQVCGEVTGAVNDNLVKNEAKVWYAECTGGANPATDEHCLNSTASVPVANLIAGRVWNDVIGYGTDISNGGIAGVPIDLVKDNDGNGRLSAGDTIFASSSTDANGNYSFVAITAGNYIIVENNLAGWTSTHDVDQSAPLPNNCSDPQSASQNGCDTIGSVVGTPTPIAVIDSTVRLNQDFFDTQLAPDLQVTKTHSAEPVSVGDTITWTITIVNNGNHEATGVTVTDILPAGVTYVSADYVSPATGTSCSENAGVVSCALTDGHLDPTETVQITITATVN